MRRPLDVSRSAVAVLSVGLAAVFLAAGADRAAPTGPDHLALVSASSIVAADPSASASPSPTPAQTTTAAPTESPTSAPSPTQSSASTAPPTQTPPPTPTASPTSAPSPESTQTAVPVPAVPPAVTTATISLPSLLIAIGVLLVGALLTWLLVRRERAPASGPPGAERRPENDRVQSEPVPVVLDSMAALGTAMIDCGYPVGLVRSALEDLAHANGLPSAEAVVFPTSILVSAGDVASAQTRAVTTGANSALLAEVDAVDRVVGVARTRPGGASWVRFQLSRIATMPPHFSREQRVGAYALLSAALSILLGSSWPGVALAGVLGIAVGVVLLATDRLSGAYRALVVVGVALGVAIAVLLVARFVDAGVLPAIVAPLVMLLPGGLLTVGVIELATGDIMSGVARVAAGAMRLLLLSVGIVAATALIGIPAITTTHWPIGPIAPWVAVAAFGVGISVYQCARPTSIGWILLVLYVAYGAQVLGDVFFNGVLSALVGAAAMTPVAVLVARQRSGPPAIVSFLPAFWLLVPGALGLMGVASALDGRTAGTSVIITTIATMVSIALGVLIGLALTGSLSRFRNSPVADWMEGAAEEG